MAPGAEVQLTTVLRRLGYARHVGPQRARPGPQDDLPAVDAVASRARSLLPAGARTAYDTLLDRALATGDDAQAEVLARALATTWSMTAVTELARVWETLPGPSRRAVHDPVATLGRAGRQSDGTTCGSAVLTMLAAHGDPALALWLATGTVVRSGRPPELAGAPPTRLAALAEAGPRDRFAPVQRVVKHRTNAGALLGLRWPASLGTPPWGAAREARFVGLTFEHVPLDDTDVADLGGVLDEVGSALDRGVPVPLYVGGDLGGGPAAAVPRHLVLAVGRSEDGLRVWEPAGGQAHDVARGALVRPSGPTAALGGWTHLDWAVLPDLR